MYSNNVALSTAGQEVSATQPVRNNIIHAHQLNGPRIGYTAWQLILLPAALPHARTTTARRVTLEMLMSMSSGSSSSRSSFAPTVNGAGHLRVSSHPLPSSFLLHVLVSASLGSAIFLGRSAFTMTTFTRIPDDATPQIDVDVARRLSKINKNIYGGFMEYVNSFLVPMARVLSRHLHLPQFPFPMQPERPNSFGCPFV